MLQIRLLRKILSSKHFLKAAAVVRVNLKLCRFTSHEGEFTAAQQLINFKFTEYYTLLQTVSNLR
jgi:hypothetical protein